MRAWVSSILAIKAIKVGSVDRGSDVIIADVGTVRTSLNPESVIALIERAEAAERSAAMPDLGSILSTALGGVGDDA